MSQLTAVARATFASLLVAAIFVPGPSSAGVAQADDDLSYVNPRYDDAATLAIEGTLTAVADTVPGSDQHAYAVRTDEGEAIAVPASFGDGAPVGGRFEGEIALTGEVAQGVRAEGVTVTPGRVIDGDTAAGQTAIAVVADHEAPVPVASATVTEPVAEAATPSAHRAYVAVITNLPGTDPSANAISDSLSFWDEEAGAAISSFTVAGTVTYASDAGDHASTGATIPSCGLQDDEWYDVWKEAAAKFPSIDFEPSDVDDNDHGNHLIVLVPGACASGTAGIGTVGDSIADGGLSVVAVTSEVDQIGAHEIGHNFGLGHANLEFCSSSCTVRPYYNLFNVMGYPVGTYAPASIDTAQRSFLDLTDDVELVSAIGSTTLKLEPRAGSSGRRGLRIIDPTTSAEYFVDYRSGTGRDASAFYATGGAFEQFRFAPGIVITQYTNQAPGKQTKVLTRPDGTVYRASLRRGESFTSANSGVRVAVDPDDASDVTVTLNGPVPSEAPTVSGVSRVAMQVQAIENTWEPGTAFTYQWRVNGAAIPGATGKEYVVAAAYYGKKLSVTVTGAKDGFAKTPRTSAASTIAGGYLIPVTPKVIGTHQVGRTLKVNPGIWKYGPKLTYRWYANGKAISNATKSTYKITKSKKGTYITVRVRATKYGFYSANAESRRVTKVR